jgi:hypothetical protein
LVMLSGFDLADQTFEICPFGEIQANRMVWRLV